MKTGKNKTARSAKLARADEPAAAPPTAGVRERKKADKLLRIRNAARALFIEKGYEPTTIKEISERARVGFGTVFSYASDKQELLFLILNDDLEQALPEFFRAAKAEVWFIDQVYSLCRAVYLHYAQVRQLSRYMMRELLSHRGGVQAERTRGLSDRIVAEFAALVLDAQRKARIKTPEKPELLAETIMAVLSWSMRRNRDVAQLDTDADLARLRKSLRLLIVGFAPGETMM
jgi:AcrR family transcriptional regulator